jgi:hypothetical protein
MKQSAAAQYAREVRSQMQLAGGTTELTPSRMPDGGAADGFGIFWGQ